MPMSLATVASKIGKIPNPANGAVVTEFLDYMKAVGAGDHHIKNELYCAIIYSQYLGPVSIFDVSKQVPVFESSCLVTVKQHHKFLGELAKGLEQSCCHNAAGNYDTNLPKSVSPAD